MYGELLDGWVLLIWSHSWCSSLPLSLNCQAFISALDVRAFWPLVIAWPAVEPSLLKYEGPSAYRRLPLLSAFMSLCFYLVVILVPLMALLMLC